MSAAVFVELLLFAVLMVGTPGPANLLLLAAGARYGLRACLPFIAGVTFGKLLLNTALALGVLSLLSSHALAAEVLRIVSGAYLLWLAWRLSAFRLQPAQGANTLPKFAAGLIVHPLNPKAWAMLTAAYAQFTTPSDNWDNWAAQSALVVLAFFLVQCVAHPLWCYGGEKLVRAVSGTVWERVLMRALALSLVALVLHAMWA